MSENTNTPQEILLPEGFEFVTGESMTPEEIFDVRLSTGWEHEEKPESKEGWLSYPESALVSVGVRDTQSGKLVGVGFVVGNERHAVLCDFNVRPEHQNKGIGTAILQERMRIVDELGIPFLYTSLAETNPLAEKYKSLGFVASGNSYFRNDA